MILCAVSWRPLGRPLLLQFLALVLVVSLAANIPSVGTGITHRVATALLLLITYPEPQQLLTAFWFGPIDWTLPALAVVVGASFVPEVWHAWQQQIQGADELARNYGWASVVDHLCNLRLMALLAAAWRPGSSLWLYWSGPALSTSAWPRSPCPATRGAGVLPVAPSASALAAAWRTSRWPARITGGVAQLSVRAAITTLEPDASNHRAPGTRSMDALLRLSDNAPAPSPRPPGTVVHWRRHVVADRAQAVKLGFSGPLTLWVPPPRGESFRLGT